MKKTGYILFFAGLVLFTAVLGYYGFFEIISALSMMGAGLFLVAASHLLPLFLDSLAWKPLLFNAENKIKIIHLLRARWVGESINSLLPAAQVGGDFVRARMLATHHGVNASVAGASVVVELTISVITQVLFTLMGIGCLLIMGENSMAWAASVGAMFLVLLTAGFITAQRLGMWKKFVGILSAIGGRENFRLLSVQADALDQAAMAIYSNRRALLISVFWRLAGWIAGVVEVWIALWLLETNTGFVHAFMLESLGQAIRAAAFIVPGAIGIQEGGFVILGRLAGLSPEIALSLSLAKRFRELLLGLPGLVYWQSEEGIVFIKRIKKNIRR